MPSTPGEYDIEVYKGDDFLLYFKIRQAGGGAYVDLTGYTGLAQIRATPEAGGAPAAAMVVTIPDQVTNLGGVQVTMDEATTGGIAIEEGVYDVQLTSPGGFTKTYLKGKAVITSDVSRA